MKSADWYDKSDAQVDYFNTAYYYDVNVGSWNKPYKLV
jgi:dipeptide/tripeptide permease